MFFTFLVEQQEERASSEEGELYACSTIGAGCWVWLLGRGARLSKAFLGTDENFLIF